MGILLNGILKLKEVKQILDVYESELNRMNDFIANEAYPLIEPGVKLFSSTVDHYSWIRRETTLINTTIGKDVFIGFRCSFEHAKVGQAVQIASKVSVGNGHRQTTIEKYAWIGAGVYIDGGITIGEGAIVGAGSAVYEDVPPYSIVVGNPARFLKERKVEKDGAPEFRSFLTSQQKLLKNKQYGDSQLKDGRNQFIDADLNVKGTQIIGENVIMIGKRIYSASGTLITDGGIIIGNQAVVGDDSIIEGGGRVTIGDNTVIGKGVHILSTSHDYKKLSLPMVTKPVLIGDNVVIEDQAIIFGGVSIKSGTRIKANSLINKSV